MPRVSLILEKLKILHLDVRKEFERIYTPALAKKVKAAFQQLYKNAEMYPNDIGKTYGAFARSIFFLPVWKQNNIKLVFVTEAGTIKGLGDSNAFVSGTHWGDTGEIHIEFNFNYPLSKFKVAWWYEEFVGTLYHELTHRLHYTPVMGVGRIKDIRQRLLQKQGTFFGLRDKYLNRETEIGAHANQAAYAIRMGDTDGVRDVLWDYFTHTSPRIQRKFLSTFFHLLQVESPEIIDTAHKLVNDMIQRVKQQKGKG